MKNMNDEFINKIKNDYRKVGASDDTLQQSWKIVSDILPEQDLPNRSVRSEYRFLFAPILIVSISVVGIFIFAQSAEPNEQLYGVKTFTDSVTSKILKKQGPEVKKLDKKLIPSKVIKNSNSNEDADISASHGASKNVKGISTKEGEHLVPTKIVEVEKNSSPNNNSENNKSDNAVNGNKNGSAQTDEAQNEKANQDAKQPPEHSNADNSNSQEKADSKGKNK